MLPNYIKLLFVLKRTAIARTALTACWPACDLCMTHLLVFKNANKKSIREFYEKFHLYIFVVCRNKLI